jgi:hypothetical protein
VVEMNAKKENNLTLGSVDDDDGDVNEDDEEGWC